MITNNHPAHSPLTTRRLHQMRDILSKASEQRDGGDIGYAMSDAVRLIDEVLARRTAAFEATFPRENPEPLDGRVPIQDEDTRQMCESLEERCRTIIEAALRPVPVVLDEKRDDDGSVTSDFDQGWNAYRAAMLHAGNSPVVPDGWIKCSDRIPEESTDADGGATCYLVLYADGKEPNGGSNVGVWNVTYLRRWWAGFITHWQPLPAAPQQEVSRG